MTERVHSIYRRLFTALGVLTAVSSLLLTVLVFVDYHLSLSVFIDLDVAANMLPEMLQHVLLPIFIFLVVGALAVAPIIDMALKPLREAARRIETAEGNGHGFRLDPEGFPAETRPFALAMNTLLVRLDDMSAHQKSFAADVAHELRTPLAVLSLEMDSLDGAVRDRLKAEVRSMQRLIDQILLLSRIGAETEVTMPRAPIDLASVAADVVAMLAPGAIAQGRSIALEVADGPQPVCCWRDAVAAATRNLVENALRVTPPGGDVVVLVGPGKTLRVRDGGPGLTIEQLKMLKERHVRADNASPGGAGLGLAIVDRIMAAHGGTLSTEPEARELKLSFPA